MSDKLIKMTKIEQKPSRDLTEMNKLEAYLKENGFKYERTDSDNTMDPMTTEWMSVNCGPDFEPFDLHQIVVYDGAVQIWDVICQRGSYGADQGLLEGMGILFGPDVEGWLTAEDVIKKIEEAENEE